MDAIKENPKYFYSYAKKVKTKICPLEVEAGNLTNDNTQIAELLAAQYIKFFLKPRNHIEPIPQKTTKTFDDIQFTERDIAAAIDELEPNPASEPDGFPAIMLKKCKHQLAAPLAIFQRSSLRTSEIPSLLKKGVIIPQHNGGARSVHANYRPIAYMDENSLNKSQHGFRAGRSCLSQLLDHMYAIMELLECSSNVDVIYMDFAKAFSKVDFNIVLKKDSLVLVYPGMCTNSSIPLSKEEHNLFV